MADGEIREDGIILREVPGATLAAVIDDAEVVAYEQVTHEPSDVDILFLKLALGTSAIAEALTAELARRADAVAERGEEAEAEIAAMYRADVDAFQPGKPKRYDDEVLDVLDNAVAAEEENAEYAGAAGSCCSKKVWTEPRM